MNPIITAALVSPGWKTSEFWLHMLSVGATVATIVLGASNPVTMAIAAASSLGAVVYTIRRSGLKVDYARLAAEALKGAQNALPAAPPAPAAADPAAPAVPTAAVSVSSSSAGPKPGGAL